jgi:hypothetical protein
MRRPALLAFGLFALAASLPAEVRECLPMSAACERPDRTTNAHCQRRTGKPACARQARQASTDCSRTGRAPLPENCRLHPTPDATQGRQPSQVGAPLVAELPFRIVTPLPPDTTRDGWLETLEPLPRASPLFEPLAPRPPPLAV